MNGDNHWYIDKRIPVWPLVGLLLQLIGGVVALAWIAQSMAVGGVSDYFHPIIQIIPWDASAFALSGNFNAVVTDGSGGTGFTINHPTAGVSDFVYWKLLGWKTVSQAQA